MAVKISGVKIFLQASHLRGKLSPMRKRQEGTLECGIRLGQPYADFIREQLKEHVELGFRPSIATVLRQGLDLLMKKKRK